MPDPTIVEQLTAQTAAVADLTAKLTAAQTEAAAKVAGLEQSVQALTAERDTFKAQAEKAGVDLKAAQDQVAVSAKAIEDAGAKVTALEARLADPSFKAAAVTGTDPVPQGQKAEDAPKTLKQLEAAYLDENDPIKLEVLRQQIFEAQNKEQK
jgi:chromosome segregation ATPase